jgi:uncharacterized membrane protein
MPRRLLLAIFSIACFAGAVPSAQAQKSWRIEDFQVTLDVLADGSLTAVEKISPTFTGSYNGILRTIPVEGKTSEGFDFNLLVHLVTVTDENGNALRCETSREGRYIKYKIWIPGAQDATKTVVITYKVDNAVRYFKDHDEVYWNATGTEWPVPIDHSSATINLPASAAGPKLRAKAYTGPMGSKASDADVEINGSQVSFRTRRGLNIHEGLTVVAGWDKGVVAEPGPATKTSRFLFANWPFIFPILTFAGMFWLWFKKGRDPSPQRAVMVSYEPPEKLSPGELGTLIDNKPDMRDITATLVDLAVRGYLRIVQVKTKQFLGSTTGYSFTLLKASGEWKALKAHERTLLTSIFGDTDATGFSINLSDLANRFYTSLPEIRQSVFTELISAGYYARNPSRVKNTYLAIGIVMLFVAVLAAFQASAGSFLAWAAAGALSALIVIIFAFIMPARTMRGVNVRQQVLGFKEFLNRAEKDHLARLTTSPEMFDKYLPFAMALRVEKKWAKAFEGIYQQPPDWYQGDYASGFQTSLFVNELSAMTSSAATTFASSPSASSSDSSGFGSSGSSGGGSGGGGGDAF